MAWPQTPALTKDHLDQDSDSPLSARAEMEELLDRMNLVLLEVPNDDTIVTTGQAASQNVAMKNLANVFTTLQTIARANAVQLILNNTSTATADALQIQRTGSSQWVLHLLGNNNLEVRNSAGASKITVQQNANELNLGNGTITYNGQSLIAEAGLGVNQSWIDVSASRQQSTNNTTPENVYQNTTGRPIMVNAWDVTNEGYYRAYVGPTNPPTVQVSQTRLASSNANMDNSQQMVSLVVPNNHYYYVWAGNLTPTGWVELR